MVTDQGWPDEVMNAVKIEAELRTTRAESFHLLSWTGATDLSLHLKFDSLCLVSVFSSLCLSTNISSAVFEEKF